MELSRNEKVALFSACTTLAGLSIGLACDFKRSILPGLQKIGRTDSAVKTVERKYSGQSVWQALESNADVYDYDIVRTEVGSETNLSIKGLTIHVGENTLVLIHLDNDGAELKIKRGSVLVDNRGTGLPQVHIEADGSVSDSAAGLVLTEVSKKGDVRTSVLGGAAKVTNAGKSEELKRGQTWDSNTAAVGLTPLTEASLYTVTPSVVTLLAPEIDAVRRTSASAADVHFVWSSSPSSPTSELSVSTDPGFLQNVQVIRASVTRITLNVPPGKYFWKISAKTRKEERSGESDVRSFELIAGPPQDQLLVVTPRSNERFTSEELRHGVLFNWERNPESTADVFQLSSDVAFKSSVIEQRVPANHVVVKEPLNPGAYFWRTRGTVEGKPTPFSNPAHMRVESPGTAHDPRIGQPRLLFPSTGMVVDMTEPDFLDFQWAGAASANLYRLRLFHLVRGHQTLVFEMETPHTAARLSDLTKLDKGRFLWTVEPIMSASEGRAAGKPSSAPFAITLSEGPIRLKR